MNAQCLDKRSMWKGSQPQESIKTDTVIQQQCNIYNQIASGI